MIGLDFQDCNNFGDGLRPITLGRGSFGNSFPLLVACCAGGSIQPNLMACPPGPGGGPVNPMIVGPIDGEEEEELLEEVP